VHDTFQLADVLAAWSILLEGTWITIQLLLLGLAVAIICACGKTSGPKPLRIMIQASIELIRNMPFLVQSFFFALSAIGLRRLPYTVALTALVAKLGAYATEILRAGSESIPRRQIEASLALDLTAHPIFRLIIPKPAQCAADAFALQVRYVHCRGVQRVQQRWVAAPLPDSVAPWRAALRALPNEVPWAIEYALAGDDLIALTRREVDQLRAGARSFS